MYNTLYVGDTGDLAAQQVWDDYFVGVDMASKPDESVERVLTDAQRMIIWANHLEAMCCPHMDELRYIDIGKKAAAALTGIATKIKNAVNA